MSATAKPASLAEQQFAFTAYIRDPGRQAAPADIEKRRIDLYRELMFNNVESFLATSFPVLRRISEETAWMALAQDFFANHRCKTPYFAEIPEEFLEYLQHERGPAAQDFPFLVELAHYEWVELALTIAEDDASDRLAYQESLGIDPAMKVILRSVAWPLAYRFPVHRITRSFLPQTAPDQPTYLVVYRDFTDDVQFMEINAVTYRLLQLVEENQGRTIDCSLRKLCGELAHPQPDIFFENAREILQGLYTRGIIALLA